jgi:hypothetical protein
LYLVPFVCCAVGIGISVFVVEHSIQAVAQKLIVMIRKLETGAVYGHNAIAGFALMIYNVSTQLDV